MKYLLPCRLESLQDNAIWFARKYLFYLVGHLDTDNIHLFYLMGYLDSKYSTCTIHLFYLVGCGYGLVGLGL